MEWQMEKLATNNSAWGALVGGGLQLFHVIKRLVAMQEKIAIKNGLIAKRVVKLGYKKVCVAPCSTHVVWTQFEHLH